MIKTMTMSSLLRDKRKGNSDMNVSEKGHWYRGGINRKKGIGLAFQKIDKR